MVKQVTKYITEDGKEFDSLNDAKNHEEKERTKAITDYHKYLHSWAGKDLLKKYKLETEGMWRVTGEDPNPDFGGHHSNPFIANVEGKLDDVIKWAVVHPMFWSWGGGGRIERIFVTKI